MGLTSAEGQKLEECFNEPQIISYNHHENLANPECRHGVTSSKRF